MYLETNRNLINLMLQPSMSLFTYHSKVRLNCRNIEDALQRKISGCPLGIKLHRAISCGGNMDADYEKPDYLCKTFLTSFRVTTQIDGSSIGINGREVKIVPGHQK